MEFGVFRQVWDLEADGNVVDSATYYSIEADRLRDLLNLAALGSDIDGLMLSLEAAALGSDDASSGDE